MILDNEDMVYNLEDHRYELTSTAIDNSLGINAEKVFGLDTTYVIKHISRMVYTHIANKTPQLNNKTRALYLSSDEYRSVIKEAMVVYFKELYQNKGDKSNYEISENGVSGAVHDILYNGGVIFRGSIPSLSINDFTGYGVDY